MTNYSFINDLKYLQKTGEFLVEGRRFTLYKWAYVFALNLSKSYGRMVSVLAKVKNSATSDNGYSTFEVLEEVYGAHE